MKSVKFMSIQLLVVINISQRRPCGKPCRQAHDISRYRKKRAVNVI